jgi:multiple antibiotic resistance protein
MGLEFWDLVVIFIVVAGPSKSLAMFVATAGRLPVGERVAIVAKALVTAAVILLIFAVLGQQIIKFFHVSVPALQIAGGVILFVFALDLVLGHSHEEHFAAHDPRAMAVYPLAMPLIASPQAIVAVVVTMSRLPAFQDKLPAFGALVTVLAFDAAVLFGTAYIMKGGDGSKKMSGGVADVFLRVTAVLLCALAAEFVLQGLRDLGVIAKPEGH